jgi:hypothetical protein
VKHATFPSLRVAPQLREAAEQVLQEGESLSSFVEQSVREGFQRRRAQRKFVAPGLRSRDKARRSGKCVEPGALLAGLEEMLVRAKAAAKKRR